VHCPQVSKQLETCLSAITSLDYGLYLSLSLLYTKYEFFRRCLLGFRDLIKFKRSRHIVHTIVWDKMATHTGICWKNKASLQVQWRQSHNICLGCSGVLTTIITTSTLPQATPQRARGGLRMRLLLHYVMCRVCT